MSVSSLTQSSYPGQGLIVMGTGPSSGIDYTTILNALDQSLSEPITLMQQQETPLNNQLSAWESISGDVSSLSSAASALGQSSLFQTYTASSSNDYIASGTASSSAIPGTYNFNVNQLAQAEVQVSSSGVSSTSSIVGTTGSTFSINGSSVTLNYLSGGETLEDLQTDINNAGLGVTASILNNGAASNPYYLTLTSNSTGTSGNFTVTDGLTGGSSLGSFNTAISGENASLSYGTINVQSQTNTVSDFLPGITLNLAGTGSVSMSVGLDTSAIDSAVSNFITAYNQVQSDVSTQNTVTTSTGSNGTTSSSLGPLGGNFELQSLSNQLYTFMGGEANGLSGTAGLASTFGISFVSGSSGQIQLDKTTLNDMLNSNPTEVQNYFSALVNGSSTADGVSESGGITYYLNTYTNPANGVITYQQNMINSQLTNMNNQISLQQSLVQQQMGLYTKEFSSLESYIGQMQTTNTSLADSVKQLSANGG